MKLENYPTGTKINIANRIFEKDRNGTFWTEISTNVMYSSFSLRCLEMTTDQLHIVCK
jgi:hypothetical protein